MKRPHLLIRGALESFSFFLLRVLAPSLQQKHNDIMTMTSIMIKRVPIPAIIKPVVFCSDRDIPKQEEEEEDEEEVP